MIQIGQAGKFCFPLQIKHWLEMYQDIVELRLFKNRMSRWKIDSVSVNLMNTEKNCHQVFVGKEKDFDAIEHKNE